MRAYLSTYTDRIVAIDGYRRDYERAALAEATRVLATAEPNATTNGVRNRHYDLRNLGYAGRNLAESIAAILPVLDVMEHGAPAIEPIPHVAGFAPSGHPASETRPFVLEGMPLYCGTGRPLRINVRAGRGRGSAK